MTAIAAQIGSVETVLPTPTDLTKAIWGRSLNTDRSVTARMIMCLSNALAELRAAELSPGAAADFDQQRCSLVDQLVGLRSDREPTGGDHAPVST